MDMRMNTRMNMMLDVETLTYIRAVADRLFEGNRSQAVRYLVREAYAAKVAQIQAGALPDSDLAEDKK